RGIAGRTLPPCPVDATLENLRRCANSSIKSRLRVSISVSCEASSNGCLRRCTAFCRSASISGCPNRSIKISSLVSCYAVTCVARLKTIRTAKTSPTRPLHDDSDKDQSHYQLRTYRPCDQA